MYYLLGQVGDVLLFNLDVPLEHAGDVGDALLFPDHLQHVGDVGVPSWCCRLYHEK